MAAVPEGEVHSAPGSTPKGGDGKGGVRENQLVLATRQQTACGRKAREGADGEGRRTSPRDLRGAGPTLAASCLTPV